MLEREELKRRAERRMSSVLFSGDAPVGQRTREELELRWGKTSGAVFKNRRG